MHALSLIWSIIPPRSGTWILTVSDCISSSCEVLSATAGFGDILAFLFLPSFANIWNSRIRMTPMSSLAIHIFYRSILKFQHWNRCSCDTGNTIVECICRHAQGTWTVSKVGGVISLLDSLYWHYCQLPYRIKTSTMCDYQRGVLPSWKYRNLSTHRKTSCCTK